MIKKIKNIFYVKDREEKQEINKHLLITVVSVFITVISVIGVSFAAFVWSDNSEKEQKIAVGNLNLAISSDSAPLGSGLNYPVNDTDVGSLEPYTFTVTNNGSLSANYTIKLVDDTDAIASDGCAGNQIDKNYVYGNVSGASSISNTSLTKLMNTNLDMGILLPGESKTYNLKLWIYQTVPNSVIGGHFHGKIQLETSSVEDIFLPPEYQRVEYIKSTGTQYIDTGYVNSNDYNPYKIEVDFQYDTIPTETTVIFGTAQNTSNVNPLIIGARASGEYWFGHYGSTGSSVGFGTIDTNRHQIKYIFNEGVYLDNVLQTTTVSQAKTSSNSGKNIGLFARIRGTTPASYGSFRLYSCKFYERNNIIVRNFVPCYRKSDNVAGLYDVVNNEFYTNAGTGNFVVEASVQLPPEYQRVEYIESTGTQYINTGYNPTKTLKIETDISIGNSNKTIFGAYNNNSERLQLYVQNSTYYPVVRIFGSTSQVSISSGFTLNSKHNIVLDLVNLELSLDGQTGKVTDEGCTNINYPIYVLAGNSSGTANTLISAKLYSFRMWDDNVLVRDFVPCYRKSDNVAGLYDVVNNKFYTNAGTGNFVVGDKVF